MARKLVLKALPVWSRASIDISRAASAKGTVGLGFRVVHFVDGQCGCVDTPLGGSEKGKQVPGFTRDDFLDAMKRFSAGCRTMFFFFQISLLSRCLLFIYSFIGSETFLTF